MIRRLLELLKLIKPRQPHLQQTDVTRCFMCRNEKPNDGHTCCEDCAGVAF